MQPEIVLDNGQIMPVNTVAYQRLIVVACSQLTTSNQNLKVVLMR